MTYEIYIGDTKASGNAIYSSSKITDLSVTRNPSAMSDFSTTVDYNASLEDLLDEPVYIYHDNSLIWKGNLETWQTGLDAGVSIGGRDILKELTETTDTISYNSQNEIAVLEDFWTNYTPFNFSVARRPPIAREARSASSQFDIGSLTYQPSASSEYYGDMGTNITNSNRYPYTVTAQDELEFYNTGSDTGVSNFTTVAGSPSFSSGVTSYPDDGAISLGSGDHFSKTKRFEGMADAPDYDVPSEDIEIWIYFHNISSAQADIYLNGNVVVQDAFTGSDPSGWYPVFDNHSPTSEAGNKYDLNWGLLPSVGEEDTTVDVGVKCTSGNFSVYGIYVGDVEFSPKEFDWTGANQTPGVHGDGIEVQLNPKTLSGTAGNVEMNARTQQSEFSQDIASTVETAVSNDGAVSWNVESTSVSPRDPITNVHEFAPPSGTDMHYAYVFKPYRNTSGVQIPHDVTDISELSDIREWSQINATFEGSYLDIARELHETLGYRFSVVDYSNDEVESFAKREERAEPDLNITDYSRERDIRGYFNRIIGKSSGLSDVIREDTAEQAFFGKTIEVARRFPNAENQNDLETKTESALTDGVQQRGDTGDVSATPQTVPTGYRYPVGVFNRVFSDGDNIGLNALRFTRSDNEYASYEMGDTQVNAVDDGTGYGGYAIEFLLRVQERGFTDDTDTAYILSSSTESDVAVLKGDGTLEVTLPGETTLTASDAIQGGKAERVTINMRGDSGDSILEVFVDGVLIDSMTTTSTSHDFGTLWMGRKYDEPLNNATALDGGLDDFRFVAGKRLTQPEIDEFKFTEIPDDEMVPATSTTSYESMRDYFKFDDNATPETGLNSAIGFTRTVTIETDYDNALGTLQQVEYNVGTNFDMSLNFLLSGRIDVELTNVLHKIDAVEKSL